MQHAAFPTVSDSSDNRKRRRSAYIVGGGLVAVAIITAAIIDLPGGRTFASGGPVEAGALALTAAPADRDTTTPSASSGSAAAPHFERSDEPAQEDTVNAHGG
jgi:hypothetical protein